MKPLALTLALALVAAAALAGCGGADPCDGHAGACLSLRVEGPAAVGVLDQLAIHLSGAAQLDGRTPGTPGKAVSLPIATAIYLPAAAGAVDVSVIGLRGGAAVGAGDVAVAIRPGAHVAATVRLDAPGGGGADLSLSDDLALGGDGGGGGGDLASSPDLAPPPRYMFLLGMHGSNLGAEAALDGECTSAAAAAGLPATPYKVVIAYPTSSPHDALDLTAGRSIVLPDGTQIATDATFFSSTHLHAIEQLANGQIAHGCVFTDFNPNGDKIAAAAGDCGGWTGASSDVAYVGDSSKSDLNWNFSDTPSCVALSCYLYCIQQQ